ncbi:MAG: LytTR family transcriptional regulator [Eubacterium sp.]|nr:LytTR family transcriptional regulator [Eubacterium sp.]
MYCKDSECFSNKSITEWESELKGYDFFRCQRSYIINLRFVRMIERGRVEIYGGASIPVSRRLDAQFDKVYDDYLIRSI